MRVSACAQGEAVDVRRPLHYVRRTPLPWAASVGVLTALGLLCRPVTAQSPDSIRVERQPGAEDCPDTDVLASRVAALLGRPSDRQAPPYLVTFARTTQGFTAAIRSADETATMRRLRAREPNCSALAHATAVALAVLLDTDLDAKWGESNAFGGSGSLGTSDTSDAAT